MPAKRAHCGGLNICYIYNIYVYGYFSHNYKQAVSRRKMRSLEQCLKLERWQGLPSETVWNCVKVSFSIQFIQPWNHFFWLLLFSPLSHDKEASLWSLKITWKAAGVYWDKLLKNNMLYFLFSSSCWHHQSLVLTDSVLPNMTANSWCFLRFQILLKSHLTSFFQWTMWQTHTASLFSINPAPAYASVFVLLLWIVTGVKGRRSQILMK